MVLSEILTVDVIEPDLKATDKVGVLHELVGLLVQKGVVEDKEETVQLLLKREELMSTGIGHGVAIPHAKNPKITTLAAAFGRSKVGVDFQALDDQPVYLIFLLLAPEGKAATSLKLLARISRLLKCDYIKERLKALNRAEDMLRLIKEEEMRLWGK